MPKMNDFTGKRFGRLIVIKVSEKRGNSNQIMWECLCDCGNNKIIVGTSLKSGNTKSCGCYGLNLVGKRFGRLVVKELIRSPTKAIFWSCLCDCGNTKNVSTGHLTNGDTKSCGCLNKECCVKRFTTHGHYVNKTPTPEYQVWHGINVRCYNKKHKGYARYGARGIEVCDRWKNSFVLFLKDMGLRPSDKHSIDRINNLGNYEPSNCRWTTIDIQSRNKRNNRWIEYNGEKMVMEDWAKNLNTSPSALFHMLKRKTFEQAYIYYTYNRRKRWIKHA